MTFNKLPLIALAATIAMTTACTSTTEGSDAMATDSTRTPATSEMPMAAPTPMATPMSDDMAMTPNPMVGGAEMMDSKTIVENASAAPNLTTLVAAVKAADLVGTLSGPGPFTVFAPTNEAFGRLAAGTVDTLMKPANKPSLVKVLTYHVVPGNISLDDLKSRIQAGGGSTTLTTVEGGTLTVAMEGAAITLTDSSGGKSYIQTPDVRQSNGVVHVVNGVLIPKLG